MATSESKEDKSRAEPLASCFPAPARFPGFWKSRLLRVLTAADSLPGHRVLDLEKALTSQCRGPGRKVAGGDKKGEKGLGEKTSQSSLPTIAEISMVELVPPNMAVHQNYLERQMKRPRLYPSPSE